MNCKMRKTALFHPQSRPTNTETQNTKYDYFVCFSSITVRHDKIVLLFFAVWLFNLAVVMFKD